MPLQKQLLRAMLYALALSAAAGVLIIFVPGKEISWRVFGTGMLTSVTIAFAIPAARLMDHPARRVAGLWAMGVIVATYCTALLGVWAGLFGSSLDDELGFTAFALGVCGIASTCALAALPGAATRIAALTGLACTAAIFCLIMFGIWCRLFVSTSTIDENAYMTAGALLGTGLLACLCLIGAGTDRAYWRYAGVLAAAAAFAMACYGIWIARSDQGELPVQFIIIAAAAAHANVILRISLPSKQRWLSLATIGAGLATALGATYLNWATAGYASGWETNELAGRVFAAAGIATGCGSLAIVILSRYNKRATPLEAAAISTIAAVSLRCPHCQLQQSAPVGSSGCVGCGLILAIKVSEPRCTTCGYNTLNLRGETCPECGAALWPRGKVIPAQAT